MGHCTALNNHRSQKINLLMKYLNSLETFCTNASVYPRVFLCCQQKPRVFIMQFASSLKHNSIGWIWAKPAKHLETILSALSTVQSSTPSVRVQLRVSTHRIPGSFWDIEIWSDAFISGFRSIYIAALPKRIAPKSSLQALRGLERDVVIQRIKEETSLYTERVCYVPSPAFGENAHSRMKFACYVIFYLPNSNLTVKMKSQRTSTVLCSASGEWTQNEEKEDWIWPLHWLMHLGDFVTVQCEDPHSFCLASIYMNTIFPLVVPRFLWDLAICPLEHYILKNVGIGSSILSKIQETK